MTNIKEDEFSDVRYQDLVSHDQFSVVVNSGPMWYRVANKFRTPFNHDLVDRLNGPAGSFFTSSDGGNWWFRGTFRPLKITWDKTKAYRLNEADSRVERHGLTSYARMIPKSFGAVTWPAVEQMVDRTFKNQRVEHRVLSPKQALDSGYRISSTVSGAIFSRNMLPDNLEGEPSFQVFPHNLNDDVSPVTWLEAPLAPTPVGPAPNIADYQYAKTIPSLSGTAPDLSLTTSEVLVTLPLFQTDLAKWQEAKQKYDDEYAEYLAKLSSRNVWRNNSCVFVRIHNGKVSNILSSTKITEHDTEDKYVHVGLIACYGEHGQFIGWGAVHETRIVFTEQTDQGDVELVGPWIPRAAGITTHISKWNETGNDTWVRVPDNFNFAVDPNFQGPF